MNKMHKLNKIIDLSSWFGEWPFIKLSFGKLEVLQKKLESCNIKKTFISPIRAVFEQDHFDANKELLRKVNNDFFVPCPVINLNYPNWKEVLTFVLKDNRVKNIKLLPNYHMYTLDEEILGELVSYTQKNKIIISIQIRIEDFRGQYPLLKVKDVNVINLVKCISAYPKQTFIIHNTNVGELKEVLFSVENAYVDLATVEFSNILKKIYDEYTLNKILFSTHCPFYFPEGNINKLKYADLKKEEVEKVAFKNLEKLQLNL
jgi:hypothetical protein